MSDQIKRIDDTAAKIYLKEAFIGAATCRLERVYLDDENNPYTLTAGVDGKKVYYYLPFVAKLSDDELLGLMLHESMHYILLHMFRRNTRDPELWNIACDAVINHHLRAKAYRLPGDGVYIDWVTEEHSAEQVYAKLLQEQDNGGDDGDGGDGEQGEAGAGGNGPNKSWGRDLKDAPDDVSEAEVAATMVAAAKMAKAAGQGGLLIDRVLDGALAPKVPWQSVLRSLMVGAFDRTDFTYRRFNRRLLHTGLYLPGLYSETMGKLVIGVDTSGSIGTEILRQVAGEISAIVQDCRPSCTQVVYCDYNVTHTETFAPEDQVQIHPKGGGGTRFKPVFDWVADNSEEPVVAMIYITDTYGNFSELEEPAYPVIWGLTEPVNNFTPPFGRTVNVYE